MRRALLEISTCLVALCAACSASESGTPTVTPAPEETAPTMSATGAAGALVDGRDIGAALLTPDDLPNWSADVLQEPLITEMFCNEKLEPTDSIVRKQSTLANQATGEGVFESISLYSPDGATSAVANARDVLGSCLSWNKPLPNGRLAVYTPSKLDLTPTGDETIAASVAIVSPGRVNGYNDVVIVRRGRLVMTLSYLTPQKRDSGKTDELLQSADNKLRAIAATLD